MKTEIKRNELYQAILESQFHELKQTYWTLHRDLEDTNFKSVSEQVQAIKALSEVGVHLSNMLDNCNNK